MDPPPTRSASRFLPGTPDTSTSCGSRRPARGTRSVLRSAGTRGGDRRFRPGRPVSRPLRISPAAASTALRSSSSESSLGRHARASPPTALPPSTCSDPRDEPLVDQRDAELACLVGARAGCGRSRRAPTARRARRGRAVASRLRCRARAPVRSRAHPRAFAPRRTSHGRPTRFAPRGSSRQRPVMRRWLRSTAPPSKRSSRFFPTASTDSNRRPSRRSAIPFTAARGCGVSTSTRSPTSGCNRAAARRSESPSGTTRG